MSKKVFLPKIFLAIAVTFLVPLSFYLIAKLLHKDKLNLPRRYGFEKLVTKTVDGKQIIDSDFHHVTDLVLVNQLGQQVSLNNDLKGKILVVNFFFSHCPIICPKLTNNIKLLQRAFRKDPKREAQLDNQIQFISLTVDPERDSFQQLRMYADHYGVNHDHWYLLTGEKKKIYDFARNELLLSVGQGDGGAEDFIHTENITILDADRCIRGYYAGLDSLAIAKCAYDLSLLTMEKKKQTK
jgi:protein SCO1/2